MPALVGEGIEAVSARALAPLPRLLDYAAPLIAAGAVAIFPKGEGAEREIAELTGPDATRRFSIHVVPSRFRSGSSLLIVKPMHHSLADPALSAGA